MNWKAFNQVALAAVVGAGIFQAGRIVAIREFLNGGYEPAPADDVSAGGLIAEPKEMPKATVAQAPKAEEKDSSVRPFKRKKFSDPPLAMKDKELVAACERAVQNGDFDSARKLAAVAAKATRSEVREAAVSMLGWFGKRTIAELTPFLADKDEGVSMEASAHWKRIFANECNDSERLDVAELVMNRLTSETMLDELGVEDMFNEVENENAAVEKLIAIIKTGNPVGVKVAKSAYDTVTGEEWKDEESARKWMKENS